ncbi:MAG TPA: type II CAAX endopeptidase family protein [Candidatus Omnitrophota bacterium]|nr:type II CAAX endopeptidase family protein [Candidatus Omnitrophota bacterium]HPS20433.1 type II CAAX endopeptidase family protein [Candidatus Omnitrophota bacterium]
MIKKIFGAAARNKMYIVLVAFIIAIHAVAFLNEKTHKKEVSASSSEDIKKAESAVEQPKSGKEKSKNVFDSGDIKEREAKLKALAEKNPKLYIFIALINLAVMFVIFIGFMLNGYWIKRAVRKETIMVRTNAPEPAKWTMPDVVRVIIIFFASGYLVLLVQELFAKAVPIFNNDNFRMILDTGLMNLVAISVIVYFVVKKYGQTIADIGLTVKGWGKNVFYAVVGYVSLLPILLVIMVITFFVVQWLKYEPPVQPIVQVFMEEKGTGILLMSTLFAAIFGPVAEEIFFRGFVYSALKRRIGVFWGMVIVSSVFSVLHAHIVGVLPIFALGMLLNYLYEKTGSLVSCMAVHMIHNVGMVALVFFVKGLGV